VLPRGDARGSKSTFGRMRLIGRHTLIVAAMVTLLQATGDVSVARAETFYRYVDERGVVHLTDSPADRRFARYEIPQAFGTLGEGPLVRPRTGIRAYDHLIARAARQAGLPAALVKAVVKAESNFQPRAVSRKGAQGLMQLMPDTAAAVGVQDPLEPADNLEGGARYLRAMIERYGNWNHALAAYNAGPEAVDRYGGVPPFRETREYVKRVLHYYRRYNGELVR
jgi:soluble lytic murein transglycosylase-like protein